MSSLTVQTDSVDGTHRLGRTLGALLPVGAVVLLHGDLGAGKTTLTQGIADGLGIIEPIQSPTFTLVAEHVTSEVVEQPMRLYHLDLYRLSDESDLESIDWEHYRAPNDGISVIEWPERAGSWLPDDYLLITLEQTGPDQRRITIEAVPAAGAMAAIVEHLVADTQETTA